MINNGNAAVKKTITSDGTFILMEGIKIKKIHPNAENLTKMNEKDPCYEVTLISRDENRVDDVYGDANVFNTGLIINPPKNFHVEILEHPQLFKTGYSLQGGTRFYNSEEGELIIPLYKYKETEDLELPFRAVVLFIRQTENTHVDYVAGDDTYEREEEQPKKKGITKKKGAKGTYMF